jgi:hypothetical protein
VKINAGNENHAIHVYYSSQLNDPSRFHALLNGIEEEGIPFFTKEKQETSALESSYQAALDSNLGVGIGIGGDGHIILHYTKLCKEEPLFTTNLPEWDKQRVLGANAARLVKGIPFKSFEIIEEQEMKASTAAEEEPITKEEIAAIVAIVLKRLKKI